MAGDIRGKKPHMLPPLKSSSSPRGPPPGDGPPLPSPPPTHNLGPLDPGHVDSDHVTQVLQSPAGRLTKRHRVNLKSLPVTPKGGAMEEDFRTLSIGSPVPCGGHLDDLDLGEQVKDTVAAGRDMSPGAFPAITVDRCEEEEGATTDKADGDDIHPLSSSFDESSLQLGSPPVGGLPYRRSISIQDSMTHDNTGSGSLLSPAHPVFGSRSDSSRVMKYYSKSGLPPSKSEGDILASIKQTDQRFQCPEKHQARFQIEIDRPPTPWKSPPDSPRVSGGPLPLSPLSTPRKAVRISPVTSPRSPRKPVRLVPLQYSKEAKSAPPDVLKE